MRATSQNQLAAVYMGISVTRVFSLTWTIAAALGGIGGILLSPITFVHMNMGFIGLKAFPAAVLGGFGSLPGAIVGGIMLGVLQSLVTGYLSPALADVVPFIVLLIILIIRPCGLFGLVRIERL